MATPKVYVFCDQNCKFESMTKEQILAAIMQAVNEGTIGNVDAGFITTIKTINGLPLRFFYGEQSAFDALTDKENLFAIITNDTTKEDINAAILNLQAALDGVNINFNKLVSDLVNGVTKVKKAELADGATKAEWADGASMANNAFWLVDVESQENTISAAGLYAVTFDNGKDKDFLGTTLLSISDLSKTTKGPIVEVVSEKIQTRYDSGTKTIICNRNSDSAAVNIKKIHKIATYSELY